MNQKPPQRLATLGEAAEFMHCSIMTVRRKIAAGDLSGYRLGPRMVRVDMDEVEALARPIPTAGDAA